MNTAALAIDYVDQKTNHKFHLPISVFKKPKNAREYAALEKILDKLIDEVRDNDRHPLTIVMQIIGENLEQYDNEHYPAIGDNINDIDMVKYLMKSHNLPQVDLADIFGGQSNVSKYLNGERPLSKNQIVGLKKRFGISADFFVK
ncbi:MAG TPA: helix-turn-helix domain-containing protein [Gammaproteobacteria bacterium]|jgi:HTH-type transcriptional regulator/antitoxin HigA|nr:helix-turn-helix domain-containing protein [Gammaproteobacteria bacterium]